MMNRPPYREPSDDGVRFDPPPPPREVPAWTWWVAALVITALAVALCAYFGTTPPKYAGIKGLT